MQLGVDVMNIDFLPLILCSNQIILGLDARPQPEAAANIAASGTGESNEQPLQPQRPETRLQEYRAIDSAVKMIIDDFSLRRQVKELQRQREESQRQAECQQLDIQHLETQISLLESQQEQQQSRMQRMENRLVRVSTPARGTSTIFTTSNSAHELSNSGAGFPQFRVQR